MRFLFVHQNFPGQFRHLARRLADDPGNEVVAIGEARNLQGREPLHPRIRRYSYAPHRQAHESTHHYLREFEGHVCRGQGLARLLISLREKGFTPDIICAHPGWGEALFLRDVFPYARHIYYFEYYYQSQGGDVGFDPEFPTSLDTALKVRIKNSTQLHALTACDLGISPTQWQKSRYPTEYHQKISVAHEGIDTSRVHPDPSAWFEVAGKRYQSGAPIVTYLARNLEPYRGFHSLMRALAPIQKRCPEATIFIVGGDDVSYGSRLPDGNSYRALLTNEVRQAVDWTKVVFIPRLGYADYLRLLQVSAVHIYLTYPFVLSWSLLEAMSAGCAIVASQTAPVEEVIVDGVNGRLADFFDHEEIAERVRVMLTNAEETKVLRQAARKTIEERFDLQSVCLPQALKIITSGA